jgi:putative ABC transport system permease protein
MIKNYLKTAIRGLLRHKAYSLINIAGLTLGITAALLIGLFVWDEYRYDRFIPGGEGVYRVYDVVTSDQGASNVSATPPMFAATLKHEFPAVEQTTRVLVSPEYKALFEANGKQLYEKDELSVDSTFFAVFPLAFGSGSPARALDDPGAIVISQEMAQRYFGSQNPMGQKLLIDKQPVHVTGVFEKEPRFHLKFSFLRPLRAMNIPEDRMQSWGWQQFYTYVRLKKGTNPAALEASFKDIVAKRAYTQLKGFKYVPFFQTLRDIHLHSADFKFDTAQKGNITYVNALLIIAVFILVIACFNFINLSTARSIRRAKEVGVRKTIGAGKGQLMVQFIGETLLLALCSTVLAVGFTALLLPWLDDFTGKVISVAALANPIAICFFLLLAVVVGFLAGSYPAIVLSGFDPVKVLKPGNASGGLHGKIPWLRHSLVVVQFTLSILLIICCVIVLRQVDYLHNKDLGFSKDQIMFFPMRGALFNNQEAFKNELLRSPGISSVSIGYGFPGDAVAGDEILVPEHGQKVSHPITQLAIDYDYINTLQLRMVAGRAFSRAMSTDKDHAWILNETAVRELGFGTPEKALGQTLYWHPWDGNNPDSLKVGQVIGVVKDFNYKSLYNKIEPAALQIYPFAAWKVAVKMHTAGIDRTIAGVRDTWSHFVNDYPLEYKFLDENFGQMYESEDKLGSLLWIFTGIAIFVGCLGLFGLAAYTAETRRKEVGIRKILGASVKGVLFLLSRDLIGLVLISLLIASPIGWYFMNHWLQGFAYRVAIDWWMFGLAGLLALITALVTVSYQAIRAATANPVSSLRSE